MGVAASVRPLPPHARSLADLTFEVSGVRLSLSDHMARRRTAGLLILKHGEIALERYGMGNGPESRWTSMSTAKSITATLVGAALHDGAIGSLDDRCEQYLPRLCGWAYEGVTIRNLLRMCSGVAWREDYDADARSEVYLLGRAMARRCPGAVLDLICELPRAHPQGAVFNYSNGDSCVLGAVVAAATGRPLADYCAEKIWRPGGMEADGYWQLESDDGLELGGFGVSARLRDFGRFGQLVLEDGEASANDDRNGFKRGRMSSVFQLSKLKKIGDYSSGDPNANVTIAVAEILASCVQLGRTVKELSKHLGAVDHAIDGLGDPESKNRLAQSMKRISEALTTAMLELSQAISKLPSLQIGAIAKQADNGL